MNEDRDNTLAAIGEYGSLWMSFEIHTSTYGYIGTTTWNCIQRQVGVTISVAQAPTRQIATQLRYKHVRLFNYSHSQFLLKFTFLCFTELRNMYCTVLHVLNHIHILFCTVPCTLYCTVPYILYCNVILNCTAPMYLLFHY